MTVTSFDTSYFALDVPDLSVAASVKKSVTLTFSADSETLGTVEEIYYPDEDGNILIRGLGELAMSYLKPMPADLFSDSRHVKGWDTGMVTLEVVVENAESVPVTQLSDPPLRFSTDIYYCNTRCNVTPDSFDGFLNRYSQRTVSPLQPLMLTHIKFAPTSFRWIMRYESGGRIIEGQRVDSIARTVGTLYLEQYRVQELVPAKVFEVVAECVNEELQQVTDRVIYKIDHGYRRQQTVFAFTNCFGVWETEALTGADERKDELEGTFGMIDSQYRKVHTELTEEHRVCSGYCSAEQYNSLLDMVRSEHVYLLNDDGTLGEEVTITGIEFSEKKPHATPNAVYLTYRVSNMHQEVFERKQPQTGRIFDDTFDTTFE